MTSLVLASRSPARAKMLRDAGLQVEVRPSPLDEEMAKEGFAARRLNPAALAANLAIAKAQATPAGPEEWVLGADQTLEIDGEALDKPGSTEGLHSQLQRLQGRTHHLHSAAALLRGGETAWRGCASVRMEMRALDRAELDRYVREERDQVLGCVGGYRLEGPGVRLFTAVEGEYFAVLGLPLLGLLAALRDLGIAT